MEKSTYSQILEETGQTRAMRAALFKEIEGHIGRPLIAFFTSFRDPVDIDDEDADRLQDVLRRMDLSNGLVLMLSSPGGNGIASERIINICRSYSGTGEYWVIVPGKAKSAATIICLGASKILMAPTSELGPVDPQILLMENGELRQWSAHNLISSYEDLFSRAQRAKGNIQPFLLQLSHYDERDVAAWKSLVELSQDIATKALETGMMKDVSTATIRKRIKVFLNPEAGTKSHSRPIFPAQALKSKLFVQEQDVRSASWSSITDLYTRLEYYVTRHVSKVIESSEESFFMSI